MTNAQKWISTVLFLFILLLVLTIFTGKDETETEEPVATLQSPVDILQQNNCFVCHGKNLEGSGMAPALTDIKKNWNKSDLMKYLKAPVKLERNSKYNGVMPAVTNLSQKELETLTEYLLNKD